MYPNSPQVNTNTQPSFMVNNEDEIDLKVILFNYLQYWPIILIFMVAGLVSAFLFNRYATSIYKVESSILVTDDKPTLGTDLFESSGLGMLQGKNNIENEIGILKSYSIAEQTISELNLNVQYFKEDFLRTTQLYGNVPVLVTVDWKQPQLVGGTFKIEVIDDNTFRLSVEEEAFSVYSPTDKFFKSRYEGTLALKPTYTFGETVSGDNFSFKIDRVNVLPDDEFLFKILDTPTLALKFRGDLTVTPINKQASILNLSLETPVRRLGQDYINKLMEMYLQRELNEKNVASENTVQFINQQLSGITDSLRFSENRLEKYRTENRVFNLSTQGAVIFERLQELEKEKGQTEVTLNYYKTLQAYLANNQSSDLVAPSVIGITDPLLNSLVQSLSELQAEQTRLKANFTAQTPAVRENASRIQNAKRALEENVNLAYQNTQSVLSDLNNRIKMIERDVNSLPQTERNLLGIQRQFSINENIYVYLLQ